MHRRDTRGTRHSAIRIEYNRLVNIHIETSRAMSSMDTLQERLAALQETTGQLKELIDRLANIKFQPGSVPLSTSDDDNVATELGLEISQILREEEEDLELLHEEIIDLRAGRPGSDSEHRKTRLREGAQRLEAELKE